MLYKLDYNCHQDGSTQNKLPVVHGILTSINILLLLFSLIIQSSQRNTICLYLGTLIFLLLSIIYCLILKRYMTCLLNCLTIIYVFLDMFEYNMFLNLLTMINHPWCRKIDGYYVAYDDNIKKSMQFYVSMLLFYVLSYTYLCDYTQYLTQYIISFIFVVIFLGILAISIYYYYLYNATDLINTNYYYVYIYLIYCSYIISFIYLYFMIPHYLQYFVVLLLLLVVHMSIIAHIIYIVTMIIIFIMLLIYVD